MMNDLQRLIEKYRNEIAQLGAQAEKVQRRRDALVEVSEVLAPYSALDEASETLDLSSAHWVKRRTGPDLRCRRGSLKAGEGKGPYRLRQRIE